MAPPTDLARTPLYEVHRRLGARMVPFAGWDMPIQYSGVKDEHLAVRSAVGVFDVSHMGELDVRGASAVELVDGLITNDLRAASDGQAVYTCCCNDQGKILDDLIVYRLASDHVLVVCNASNHDKILDHFRGALGDRAALTDLSAATALIAVQGPDAIALLQDAYGAPLSSLRPFHTALFELNGTGQEHRIARTGYTGEDGAEIFCSNADAPALFERLVAAGAKPCGLAARDTLRLEACLRLYGNDMDENATPLEAGLGWTVKFDKREFVGKRALLEQKANGVPRKLAGFEMMGRGIARAGYALLDTAGNPCGVCTSGSPAPSLNKSVGLGYLPPSMATPGAELLVDCRGKQVAARVVKTPFYRRPKP